MQNHDLMRRALALAKEKQLRICLDLASFNIVEAERKFFKSILPEVYMVFANETEGAAFTKSSNP